MNSWQWEFGESGTVDAYDQQVVYTYENPGEYTIKLQTNTTQYPVKHHITILPRFEKAEEIITVDSLVLAQDDIRKHLQAIADTRVSQHPVYYEHYNYIRNKYFCIPADRVAVVVNGEKYNDLPVTAKDFISLKAIPNVASVLMKCLSTNFIAYQLSK